MTEPNCSPSALKEQVEEVKVVIKEATSLYNKVLENDVGFGQVPICSFFKEFGRNQEDDLSYDRYETSNDWLVSVEVDCS